MPAYKLYTVEYTESNIRKQIKVQATSYGHALVVANKKLNTYIKSPKVRLTF